MRKSILISLFFFLWAGKIFAAAGQPRWSELGHATEDHRGAYDMRRLILLPLFLFFATVAWGQGSCPTGANYLNTSGQLMTLSTLGVTNCYYIAASGSDSNTGVDESHPWLHSPGMGSQCTGNCATLQTAIVGHSINGGQAAGIGLIFRGGDTWHQGNSGASPYMGPGFNFNVISGTTSGTAAHPFYIGIDKGWYSGSSWARPVFTGDNPTTTSQTLSSCPYQTTWSMTEFTSTSFIIFDNFELTGMCTNGPAGGAGTWNETLVHYGSINGFLGLYNLYLHGWSHVQFPGNPNFCAVNVAQGQCATAFGGGTGIGLGGTPHDVLLYDVVDSADSDATAMFTCFCGAWTVAYSYFSNATQFLTLDLHSFHDNWINGFTTTGHSNVWESDAGPDNAGPSTQYAVYNNRWNNLYNNGLTTSDVVFWTQPPPGKFLNFFNNIVSGVSSAEFWNGPPSGYTFGTNRLFNNTFQMNPKNPSAGGPNQISCGSGGTEYWAAYNNHWISDEVSSMFSSKSCVLAEVNPLHMTNAQATFSGYTSSETYVYSPISSGSATVGAGTNEQAFCSALSGAATIDPTLSDAAIACGSDTRYTCTYNSSSHTVSCPARTAIPRSEAQWSIGAYENTSSQKSSSVSAPTNLTAIVQ